MNTILTMLNYVKSINFKRVINEIRNIDYTKFNSQLILVKFLIINLTTEACRLIYQVLIIIFTTFSILKTEMITTKQKTEKKNELKDLLQNKFNESFTDFQMYQKLIDYITDEEEEYYEETEVELETLELENLEALAKVNPPESFTGKVVFLEKVNKEIIDILSPSKPYKFLEEKIDLLNAYASNNELSDTEKLIICKANECKEGADICEYLKGIFCFDNETYLVWQDVHTEFFQPYNVGFNAGDFVGKEIFNLKKKILYKQIHPDHNEVLTNAEYLNYHNGVESISQYLT